MKKDTCKKEDGARHPGKPMQLSHAATNSLSPYG